MVAAKTVQHVTLAWTGKKVSGLQNRVGGIKHAWNFIESRAARLISRSIMFSDGEGVMARGEACASARLDKSKSGRCHRNAPAQ